MTLSAGSVASGSNHHSGRSSPTQPWGHLGLLSDTVPRRGAVEMGRPPNPLVVEYFRRGKKLKDKSNRYEHTCRKCGTLDRTGRPEKLIDHLVKCSQLDSDLRQDILARHLNHRVGRDGQDGISSRSATPPAYAGLEGLAEAARRVSAHEPPAFSPEPRHSSLPIDPNIDQATANFYAAVSAPQSKPFADGLDPARTRDITAIMENASPDFCDRYTIVDELDEQGDRANSNNLTPHHASLGSLPTTVTSSPAPLSFPSPASLSFAFSMQPRLPFQPNLGNNSTGPPFDSRPTTTSADSKDPPVVQIALSSPRDAPATGPLTSLGMAHDSTPVGASMVSDAGDSPKATRPKRTSKLQPQQREKTARMRQRGACIRCRLLKKPCSGDDPCQQCQNVHNPRMWRHPCQRVKLHEEISLYSANLHYHLSRQEILDLQLSHIIIHNQSEATIRVSLGSQESIISFKSQRLKPRSASDTADQDYELVSIIEPVPAPISQHDMLKISRYLKEEHAQLFERELSPIIRSTLRLAKRLATDKNDEILSATLELWAATLLLVDDSDYLKISLVTQNNQPSGTQTDTPITKSHSPQSHKLITGQLRAAIETNAATQLHKLLTKLEARLQKPKDTHFETYLACLLLLNCAERVCCFVRQWQIPDDEDEGTTTANNDDPSSSTRQRPPLPPWPLHKKKEQMPTPAALVAQGETMASVLHMIMDMRSVLPRPHQSFSTMMAAGKNGNSHDTSHGTINGAASSSGTPTLVAPPRASEDLRAWLNQLDLSVETLRMLEERPFVAGDCRSMDGRFWARTLAVEEGGAGAGAGAGVAGGGVGVAAAAAGVPKELAPAAGP